MELTKELFEDVIAYSFSEPGAMGPNGMIYCLKKSGEEISLSYLSKETPWEEIKKCFPAIDGCRFDGPMAHERFYTNIIIIGSDGDDFGTYVNPGWKHLWLDYGNHLVCKEQYFSEMIKYFDGMDNCDITFEWIQELQKTDFINRLDQIEEQYYIQKAKDDAISLKIEELRNNPEFLEEINNLNKQSDIAEVHTILQEYGIDMDMTEFKQYILRRLGIR